MSTDADLVRWARSQRRVWMYPKGQWTGWGLQRGDDEYGRQTLALRLPGERALIWAFWTCRCPYCHDSRRQTVEMLAFEARECQPLCGKTDCTDHGCQEVS